MDKYSAKERNISSDDILKALDRFGGRSKTPSPVEDRDDLPTSSPGLSFIDDPLSTQRLSFISADGSEIDSDYSSASSVIHVSDEQRNLEIEWDVLFGSTAYYTKIRQHALDGKLRFSKFRSICWKVFLECLPERKDEWIAKTTKLRNEYTQFKNKCLFDPNKGKKEDLDLAVFNPLSQEETSPWKQYFLDNELKSTIKQDLDRLFPEIEFFQQSKVKEMMLHILFCHAKKNEALSYKQGMHELLAPIIFVLTEDTLISQYLEGPSLGIARFLMDPNFLEHDAFALFVQLMDQTETWYLQLPVKGLPERNKSTAIVKKLNRIQEHMLRKYDPELWVHMKNLDITPQVYGLRWIRLLFGREFPIDDVLVLWDALFADGPMLDLVDYIYISMLEAIRDKLLVGSYTACMGYLMKFPRVYDDVYRYLKTALIMRENKPTSARSSPRPSRPPAPHHMDSSGTFPMRKKPGPKRPQSAFTSFTKRYQQFMEPTKQTTVKPTEKPLSQQTQSINSKVEELVPRGSRPARPVSVPAPEMRDRADSGSHSASPGKSLKALSNPLKGKLMTRPRTRSRVDYDELAQDHERLQKQVSSLKSELDKMQGMYLYCGRKMDSYIDLLQDELTKDEDCVRDIVYLCLAGLKQVRDLLKGTLAFRGSTMETECDFMEIDNNIASRLQIPSPQQQQKDTDIPEGLPVPMLANFDHFENSDETESSFMSGDVEGEEKEDSAGSNEQGKEDDESGLTVKETTQNVQNVEELESLNTEASSVKQGNDVEYSKQNFAVQGGVLKDASEDLFASFGEGPANIESIDSNPLFCGESQVEGVEERTYDVNSTTTTLLSSNTEHRIENESGQIENEQSVLRNPNSIIGDTSNGTDPLFNTVSHLPTQSTNPLNERKSANDNSLEELFRTESPDREFVFVNRDGTAQGEPSPSRHPLENNDEFI
ncbi:TBC1 domain family member 5-like isoform X2 [Oculina patagonica]